MLQAGGADEVGDGTTGLTDGGGADMRVQGRMRGVASCRPAAVERPFDNTAAREVLKRMLSVLRVPLRGCCSASQVDWWRIVFDEAQMVGW